MCFTRLISIFKKKKVPDKYAGSAIPTTKDHPENTDVMQNEKNQTEPLAEFQFIYNLITYRLNRYFPGEEKNDPPQLPSLDKWTLPVKSFISENQLSEPAAILLLIALIPHIQPDLFDNAIENKIKGPVDFPKLGGIRGKNSRCFLPTGETVLFLLGGDDLKKRLQAQQLFSADNFLAEKKILWLEELQSGEPAMSGKIILSQDYISIFTFGTTAAPHFSMSFPAKKIDEKRSWSALVINDEQQKQIDEILSWDRNISTMLNDLKMGDRMKKGYRVLFYGPPGTGKTLTAGLLGNELKRDVYKIDLSMIVSKYIGETEKNLELLFARAEDKNWILFFDEADALFGKRTSVRDAHDKYANQEVSYLLQRIEDYNGIIILASNMKNNIDDAFVRRFNSIIRFQLPNAEERKLIWKKLFPDNTVYLQTLKDGSVAQIDALEKIKSQELSGGNITNIVHYACLQGIDRTNTPTKNLEIYFDDIVNGVRREMFKEGRPCNI